MSLTERINQDVKLAMKARDKDRLKVLRMIKAALQNEQLNHDEPLTGDQELTILNREMKQRRDSLAEFEQAGREDLVEEVKAEIVIVEEYLPEQLSDEEIRQVVQDVIEEVGASSPSDFGKVMGPAMARLKGQADGSKVNAIVKELLH
ncbi:aspartyl-tRNA amidotransferase [Suicoccus acidiformans]|uniref:Aspartyl-tRNA amidotransferase n=1 Tax=Suicoccus acidiformans TaxID=2036206 RepID=A0A347WLG7_9LACT|nr:GatB/YqeY domain-containing protein [Suicoccus acidiformans]AXY25924.1 aspartyl-tRNA amidotransferase [Suicoccus acidiformans]